MKKLIMSVLLAWAATGMVMAGNVKKPKKATTTAQKEQCCDNLKKERNCCKDAAC